MPDSREIEVGPDPLDHLRCWRHVIQCAFAEEHARQTLAAVTELGGGYTASQRRCQAELDAAGARLNGALYELHEVVTAPHARPVSAPADALSGSLPDSPTTTRTLA